MNSDVAVKLAGYLETDELFARIFAYTRHQFEARPDLTAHNWEHARRDVLNGIVIGEAEGADMSIVLPALAMHDIGFLFGATGTNHGEVGAARLEDYLNTGKIELDQAKIEAIRACILTHKGSMFGQKPGSLEAKVVSDADFIEKFGPIGVYQAIRTFGEFNFQAEEVIKRLSKRDYELQTPTGESMKQQLIQFSTDFAAALAQAYEPYREAEVTK
ncbi:hypothetical protein HJC99_03530 [Candidatus Saccharibacteria bacterium]|nr:hypothetical protein [Candidatus Saccharibacteria bacterium]